MTTKKTVLTSRKGDVSQRKNQTLGPFKIYLPTGEVDSEGKAIQETYEDVDGTEKTRPQLETEPFLESVYFKKNYLTPSMEDSWREQRLSDEFSEEISIDTGAVNEKGEPVFEKQRITTRRLAASIMTLCSIVSSWDLNSNGVPIPVTIEAVREADLDSDIIYAIISKHNEVTRPPRP